MKIKIYYGKDKQWHIRLSGKNNRIIMDAGGYNTKRYAQKAWATVVRNVKADNVR